MSRSVLTFILAISLINDIQTAGKSFVKYPSRWNHTAYSTKFFSDSLTPVYFRNYAYLPIQCRPLIGTMYWMIKSYPGVFQKRKLTSLNLRYRGGSQTCRHACGLLLFFKGFPSYRWINIELHWPRILHHMS